LCLHFFVSPRVATLFRLWAVLVGFGPCCSRGGVWVLEGFLLSSFDVSQGYGGWEWIHIGLCFKCGCGCYSSQFECRRAVRVIPQVAFRSVCPFPLCGVPLLGRDLLLLCAVHQQLTGRCVGFECLLVGCMWGGLLLLGGFLPVLLRQSLRNWGWAMANWYLGFFPALKTVLYHHVSM